MGIIKDNLEDFREDVEKDMQEMAHDVDQALQLEPTNKEDDLHADVTADEGHPEKGISIFEEVLEKLK